jgi:D-apionolactonase
MTAARPRPERVVRAGPVTATLEDGGLRWLRLGDVEFVRGVYAAVRDNAWRTIAGELEDLEVRAHASSFEVAFRSHHRDEGIDFSWSGQITGDSGGSIRFSFDGIAGSTFERNRIGFCVLHPMSQAGVPLTVVTPTGTTNSVFPEHVSPGDPFTDIVALRFPISGTATASIRFAGDLFEMEDQRNWTDASFKTFCTPHRIPHPVTILEGTRIRQSVTIDVSGTPLSPDQSPVRPRRLNRTAAESIEVHDDIVQRLPEIGTSLAPGREDLDRSATELLRHLRPGALRTSIQIDRRDWSMTLGAANEVTRRIDTRLEVEVWVGDDGDGVRELIDAMTNHGIDEADIFIYPTTSHVTTAKLAERLRRISMGSGGRFRVGGGSRANFAELNRSSIPVDLLDVVGFAISPQVHAFDDASLVETIAAQPVVVTDASRLAGPRELAVGPITLLPRFNPYSGSRPRFGVETEGDRHDPRQPTWFAAAWTLASLAAIARVGVARVSYHEVVGPAGLIGTDGAPTPTCSVLADVLAFGRANVMRSTGPADLSVLALASTSERHARILVANLRNTVRLVELRGNAVEQSPLRWTVVGGVPGSKLPSARRHRVEIGPYGVIRFDIGTPSQVS